MQLGHCASLEPKHTDQAREGMRFRHQIRTTPNQKRNLTFPETLCGKKNPQRLNVNGAQIPRQSDRAPCHQASVHRRPADGGEVGAEPGRGVLVVALGHMNGCHASISYCASLHTVLIT